MPINIVAFHALCPLAVSLNFCNLYLQPDDMVLVNNFEDNFGDMYGTGVWSELSEAVAKNIHENTIALASFDGDFTSFVVYY